MFASSILPARPSLRHLKLEAKRRLAAGEFATLHDAQAAIAREHGLPSWARLKQACAARNSAALTGSRGGPAPVGGFSLGMKQRLGIAARCSATRRC